MSTDENENPHKDHRQRLRRRFLRDGLSGFEPHEVLEFLLFYSTPQQDTNPIAHRLLRRFGSISSVLDADIHELTEVNGVKEYSATLIKLIPEISSYYQLDKADPGESFTDMNKIAEFCVYKYMNLNIERLSVIMFDHGMHMLGMETVSEGALSSVDVNFEVLGKILFSAGCSNFIMVHNHPGGTPYPSSEDIALTKKIASIMQPFNKTLLEHIVIAGNRYVPMTQLPIYRGTI